ncbi:MAG: Cof-type HAD-IIB family hydrolase [Solobacterium sp.]|nr:Cof-type HAD-IIB family hydrolase [Solobacterium sp.]
MKKAVFASDFDRTLYFYSRDPQITEEDIYAVRKFQRNGFLFGLNTGRSFKTVPPALNGAVEPDFYATCSGAYILDKDLKQIHKEVMDRDLFIELCREYRDSGVLIVHACDETWLNAPGFVTSRHFDYPEEIEGDVNGVSVRTDEAFELAEKVRKKYGDLVSVFPNRNVLDITVHGCSKGSSIAVLKEYYHADIIFAAGDDWNDIPQIRAADVGFAFTWSDEEIRKSAAYVVDSLKQALDIAERIASESAK